MTNKLIIFASRKPSDEKCPETRSELLAALSELEGIPISMPPLLRADFGGTERYRAVAAAAGGKFTSEQDTMEATKRLVGI